MFRIGHVQDNVVGSDGSSDETDEPRDHKVDGGGEQNTNHHQSPQSPSHTPLTVTIIHTLNTHLNSIKRRHEQLDPGVDVNTDDAMRRSDDDEAEQDQEQDNKRNSIIESSNSSPILSSSTIESTNANANTSKSSPHTPTKSTGLGLDLDGGSPPSPTATAASPPHTPKKSYSFELQSPTSSSPSSSPQRRGSFKSNGQHHGRSRPTHKTKAITTLLPQPASKLLGKTALHDRNVQVASAPPYDKALHIYASKALTEYTNIVNVEYEFQDWQNRLVPRLTVQWPAAFTFD